ncbi:M48 family metalloprotease [Flavobacterium soyangense]|uniref:M48 family metalloprotease n=1 Tax=Flavobacterium soyangense TaxID=2023265 RepID=A0A930XVG2_9FLAO|nr:M48 family metalloprotease [Flavobacterium soyangense]MBF2708271.1 M48 family metalloprotease [Flavobacterium soyangense]
MKRKSILLVVLIVFFGFSKTNAQIKFDDKMIGAVQKGLAGFTFTDADAAKLSKVSVDKIDSEHIIAGATDPYMIRLNKIFGKYTTGYGYTFNYKVYIIKDVNAFATADGSVRVFSGLMDIMDDNELLVVIGHEMGHVVNHDSRDAIKAAYQKEAMIEGVASQSKTVATLTGSELGKIGSAMIDSKHSRRQESEADLFAYNFMKKNGYDVNAAESAFSILAKMSEGTQSDFITRMMSSHPDSKERAETAMKRAQMDGLYKPYVHQAAVVTPVKTSVKTTTKKTTTKKK